jgi:hypothetical protein
LQAAIQDTHNWSGSNSERQFFEESKFTVISSDTGVTTACSNLEPGDVQVVAFNADSPDRVMLVALQELSAGLALYVTDNAWTGFSFLSNEGTIKVSSIVAPTPIVASLLLQKVVLQVCIE